VIEKRLWWARPHSNVEDDTCRAGITAPFSRSVDEHPDSLVARASDPQLVSALADRSADLGDRNQTIV
jgi:hypothetical protein